LTMIGLTDREYLPLLLLMLSSLNGVVAMVHRLQEVLGGRLMGRLDLISGCCCCCVAVGGGGDGGSNSVTTCTSPPLADLEGTCNCTTISAVCPG
jgi:hypothetical protein